MPHFAIMLDPDAGYGRGIFLNGATTPAGPLDLIYGADNSVTIAFADADGNRSDVSRNDFTRLLVRIVQPDAVLAETTAAAVTGDDMGYTVLEISDVAVETPEILRQIADRRPDAPGSPDYEEQNTFCRATLEIIGFAAWDDAHFARRFGIPVRIWNRDKLPLTEPPEPHTDYLTAAETMAAIRQTIQIEGGAATPAAKHCFYHALYGVVACLDDENVLEFTGYQAAGWNRLRIWLVSADEDITGQVVLALGSARAVAAVGREPAMAELVFDRPVTGFPTLTRDTGDSRDTLKDTEGSVVTALAVDWRVC